MSAQIKNSVIRELRNDEIDIVSGGTLLSGVQALLDVTANIGLSIGDKEIGLGITNGENGLSFGIGLGPIKL